MGPNRIECSSEPRLHRSSMIWLERFYARVRLPFWIGTIVVGFLPFVAMVILIYSVLLPGLLGIIIASMPFFFIQILYWQFAAKRARKQIERLNEYSRSISQGNSAIGLDSLYGLKGELITWALIAAAVIPTYYSSTLQHYSLSVGQILLTALPWVYYAFFEGTFYWVWGYSMYSVHRMGKLPLKLKTFTQDRTLGLRPFASTSLVLTGIYIVAVGFFVLSVVFQGYASLAFMALFMGLFLIGFALFLFPLLSLRKKLLQSKREELAWIGPHYTRIMQRLKQLDVGFLDQRLVTELAAVKEIQSEIQRMRTWPFDTGIFVRLTAILLTVTAIVLSRIVTIALQP